MDKEYYKEINNLSIRVETTNHNYIMINQWSQDRSHQFGIAVFEYDREDNYWYLKTFGKFNPNVDWYDFGCLVDLGYKWIKELGWE